MKRTFIVVDYFDVWGNKKDGFEVNNLFRLGEGIELDTGTEVSNKELTLEMQDELKRIGYWKKSVNRRQWAIDWNCSDGDYFELYSPNGWRPLCRLELARE